MTAEEYRQRMIQAFQNSDCDELIALVCLPDAKEFENLEWLLKMHYKKEPCKSCISKEAVLHIFDDMTKEFVKTGDFDRASGIAWVSVQRLPSIQPEPKTGKWNKIIDKSSIWREAWHYECSNCGNYISGYGKYKYCPECGAKMVESEDA